MRNTFVNRKEWKVELEGCIVEVDPDATGRDLRPGDLFLAERNTGPKLLTCRHVDERGWVMAVESAYSYDVWECRKVISVDGEKVNV